MISKKFRKQIKNIERSKRGIKNGLIIVDAATDNSMADEIWLCLANIHVIIASCFFNISDS